MSQTQLLTPPFDADAGLWLADESTLTAFDTLALGDEPAAREALARAKAAQNADFVAALASRANLPKPLRKEAGKALQWLHSRGVRERATGHAATLLSVGANATGGTGLSTGFVTIHDPSGWRLLVLIDAVRPLPDAEGFTAATTYTLINWPVRDAVTGMGTGDNPEVASLSATEARDLVKALRGGAEKLIIEAPQALVAAEMLAVIEAMEGHGQPIPTGIVPLRGRIAALAGEPFTPWPLPQPLAAGEDSAQAEALNARRVQASRGLVAEGRFPRWLLEAPDPEIRAAMTAMQAAMSSRVAVTDQQRMEGIQHALTKIGREYFGVGAEAGSTEARNGEERRNRFANRFAEAARLLARAGRDEDARIALAISAALSDAAIDPTTLPIVQSMVEDTFFTPFLYALQRAHAERLARAQATGQIPAETAPEEGGSPEPARRIILPGESTPPPATDKPLIVT